MSPRKIESKRNHDFFSTCQLIFLPIREQLIDTSGLNGGYPAMYPFCCTLTTALFISFSVSLTSSHLISPPANESSRRLRFIKSNRACELLLYYGPGKSSMSNYPEP